MSIFEVLVFNDDYQIKDKYNTNVFKKTEGLTGKLIDDMRETVIINSSGLYKTTLLET